MGERNAHEWDRGLLFNQQVWRLSKGNNMLLAVTTVLGLSQNKTRSRYFSRSFFVDQALSFFRFSARSHHWNAALEVWRGALFGAEPLQPLLPPKPGTELGRRCWTGGLWLSFFFPCEVALGVVALRWVAFRWLFKMVRLSGRKPLGVIFWIAEANDHHSASRWDLWQRNQWKQGKNFALTTYGCPMERSFEPSSWVGRSQSWEDRLMASLFRLEGCKSTSFKPWVTKPSVLVGFTMINHKFKDVLRMFQGDLWRLQPKHVFMPFVARSSCAWIELRDDKDSKRIMAFCTAHPVSFSSCVWPWSRKLKMPMNRKTWLF